MGALLVPAVLLRCPVCALPTARLRCTPTAATRSGRFIRHWRRSPCSPKSHLRFDSDRHRNNGIPGSGIPLFGAADRNRTGTDFTPRDFKSLVSTYSTTAAYYSIMMSLRLMVPLPCCGARRMSLALQPSSLADRCHLLRSLHPPQAALPSLPGIEPVRILLRGILSPLCLPIPPQRHDYGAGYGSRTRLHGLGSRCITDIRTLRSSGIISKTSVDFKLFLKPFKFRFSRQCLQTISLPPPKIIVTHPIPPGNRTRKKLFSFVAFSIPGRLGDGGYEIRW